MKKILTFSILLLNTYIYVCAQQPAAAPEKLFGLVTNEREEILAGASVIWKGAKRGVIADSAGHFWLSRREKPSILVVTYAGYTPVEVEILPEETQVWVEITGAAQLQTVVISEHRFGNAVSTLNPRNVESINSKELRKAPCCNLSESFETNGAIDVTYADAVTGVKEIQLLGLRGIYSQFLLENRPTMTGIATPFAFEYIPGTWLDGIVLAKGASTVKNGFMGITGQINADLVKPMTDKPLFFNAFTSTEGRGEVNLHLNRKNRNFANGAYLHGSFVENKWDMNDDNFYDAPNRQQLNGLYRAQYDGPAGCAQINVQALSDRRQSGMIETIPGTDRFGVDQRNDRLEVWGKYGKEGVGGKPYQQIGNILGASWHRNNSLFGRNNYQAEQRSLYWQTLFQTIIGTTDHQVVIAPSIVYDDIQEKVNETDLSRTELVPGAMAEYTYSRPNLKMGIPDFVVVLGGRVDWNSRFGWLVTPRLSAKYNFTTESVVRLSAGRGYRSANLMAENISLLASNRRLDFAQGLGLEKAWNYGVNFTQNVKIGGRPGSVSLDLFRTSFDRQIVVDVDQSPTEVFFYNAPGASFSNSLLAVAQYSPLPGLDVKFAYKINDVRTTFQPGDLRTMPLLARHRGLVTVDYETPNKRWRFNAHTQIVGPQRLPYANIDLPHEYRHSVPTVSPTYALVNAQITFKANERWEIYGGGENLTGFQQHEAVIAGRDPWSPYFNGSQLWAPMMGAVGYIGVRFSPSGL